MLTSGNQITIRKLLHKGERYLRRKMDEKSCEDAGFESFLLLSHLFHINRTEYLSISDHLVTEEQRKSYIALLNRRVIGEPLQYILGEWEFFGLPFLVGPGVLIPRSDTETLVEESLKALQTHQNPSVLELCSGSGCISIAIQKHCTGANITAVEISPDAVNYLQKNITLNQTPGIQVICGDALKPESIGLKGPYDLIVANPPYVSDEELAKVQPELHFEPLVALSGGEGGYFFYRQFITLYPSYLSRGGTLAFEIGETQGDIIAGWMRDKGFSNVQVVLDYSGNPRVVSGKWQ